MAKEAIVTAETLRFFRELGRNNRKEWMDENRERYRAHVVEPLHRLFEALAPAMRKLRRFWAWRTFGREFFAHQPRYSFCERQDALLHAHVFVFFAKRGARAGASAQRDDDVARREENDAGKGRRAIVRGNFGGYGDSGIPDLRYEPRKRAGAAMRAEGGGESRLA